MFIPFSLLSPDRSGFLHTGTSNRSGPKSAPDYPQKQYISPFPIYTAFFVAQVPDDFF